MFYQAFRLSYNASLTTPVRTLHTRAAHSIPRVAPCLAHLLPECNSLPGASSLEDTLAGSHHADLGASVQAKVTPRWRLGPRKAALLMAARPAHAHIAARVSPHTRAGLHAHACLPARCTQGTCTMDIRIAHAQAYAYVFSFEHSHAHARA